MARGGARGAYGPSRQVRTALDDRQTFALVPRRTRPRRRAAHRAELCPESSPACSRLSDSIGPPDSRWWSGVRLDRSGVVAGVVARVVVTSDTDRGGGVRNNAVWVSGRHMQLSLVMFVFFVVYRPRRDAPAKTERTGATPIFLPLVRHGEGGSVSHGVRHRVRPSPTPWGSLPSVCIPAGRLPGRASGPDTDARRARPIDGAPCGRLSAGIVMDFRPSASARVPHHVDGADAAHSTHRRRRPGARTRGHDTTDAVASGAVVGVTRGAVLEVA